MRVRCPLPIRGPRAAPRALQPAHRPATLSACGLPSSLAASAQAYYPCVDRIPVFSTGVSFRFNLMGYVIMEAYLAHPFQRPTKNWVWGFQLAPGW